MTAACETVVCVSLSQIPQALTNQDLNTPFDPVIVSLRRTAKLNGKIWFLYSREDYKPDAKSIMLKDSKHICCKEHLLIKRSKIFFSVSYPICASVTITTISQISLIFYLYRIWSFTLNTHSHTLSHTRLTYSKEAIKTI